MSVSQLPRQEAGLSLTSLLSEDGTHRWDTEGDMAKEAQCLELSALCPPPPPASGPSFAKEPKSLRAAIDDSLRVFEGFRQVETTGFIAQSNRRWLI